MSKEKIRDLIICLIALTVLVLTITTNVFATDGDIENELGGNSNQNVNNTFSNIGNSNVSNNTNINNANTNKANTNNSNTNTNNAGIPYAGVDYSVVTIIIICGVSAIYAYKKIRDYKSL